MTVTHPFPPPEEGGPYLAGRSAWTHWGHNTGDKTYYYRPLHADGNNMVEPEDFQIGHAVRGIQRTLDFAGYKHPIYGRLPANGVFGNQSRLAVRWLQEKQGLKVDGVFGRATAKSIFVPFTYLCTIGTGVPAQHVCGMFDYESSWDHGAVSTWYKPQNGPDRGLAQINQNAHREVSDAQAFDPLFAVPYAVERLRKARIQFGGKGPDLQTFCSIAQHNSPAQAAQLYATGEYPSVEIQRYVERVLARASGY